MIDGLLLLSNLALCLRTDPISSFRVVPSERLLKPRLIVTLVLYLIKLMLIWMDFNPIFLVLLRVKRVLFFHYLIVKEIVSRLIVTMQEAVVILVEFIPLALFLEIFKSKVTPI